ncbi:hypothetical protein V6N13_045695 [Hibiscus sabdariffa]|uniref:Protein BIG GRAIN 1-like B n=2 Tax=Hibiscus sabdariffa TaxID=183260 RepID=A0ABR2BDM9_9ROSI
MKTSMRDNPSFSSTLLDRICRSIDDGRTGNEDMKFYGQTMQRTQRMSGFQRACLIENLMEKKDAKKENEDRKHGFPEFVRKSHHEHEHDHDGVFVSSTKAPSCFVRPWPRPVKIRVPAAAQSDKPVKTEQSAAEKIYGGFKKMKQRQPISPGGRLASFINSLFTTGNTKKPKSSSSTPSFSSTVSHDQNQASPCSSASRFSRPCLSKDSPSTRDGAKRTVRFCPVTVIVDQDSRPCEHKEIGKSSSRKYDGEMKFQTTEKTRRVEQMAREFLKEYHLNQKKNEYIPTDSRMNYEDKDDHDEDDNEDMSSCSSSDLFELNHLVLLGNHGYEEELPVYETTHVETNRAIANGLIV